MLREHGTHPVFSDCALVLSILFRKKYSKYIIRNAHKILVEALDVRHHLHDLLV